MMMNDDFNDFQNLMTLFGVRGKFQNILGLGLGLGCLDVSCMARLLSVFLTKFKEAKAKTKTAKKEREKRIRLKDLTRFFVCSVSVICKILQIS